MITSKIIRTGFIELCYNLSFKHSVDDIVPLGGQAKNRYLYMSSGNAYVIYDDEEIFLPEGVIVDVSHKVTSHSFATRVEGNCVGIGFNAIGNENFVVEKLPSGLTSLSSEVEKNSMVVVVSGKATANSIEIPAEKFAYIPVGRTVDVFINETSDVFIVSKT